MLSSYYLRIFFIDGELDHKCYEGHLSASYRNLTEGINNIKNVTFLYETIVIVNNTTLIGANGWTTFDATNKSSCTDTMHILDSTGTMTQYHANNIFDLALSDQHYLYNSIDQCQEMNECANIIIVTHTVPQYEFISHNDKYSGTIDGDTMVSNGIVNCLSLDKYGKVHSWIFGKFEEPITYTINDLNYISNPGIDIDFNTYFPRRIEI